MSVGLIFCFTLLGYFSSDLSLLVAAGLSLKNPVLLALIFVAAATLVSFLHLGNPANAPNALNNLSGSWLSREILALGVYSVCLLTTLVLGWRGGNTEYSGYFLMLCSVVGLALLSMMIRLQPRFAWASSHCWLFTISGLSVSMTR
jgi:anaerobic dimethyl sulfoxide reductase subunit C (anchor subunit)